MEESKIKEQLEDFFILIYDRLKMVDYNPIHNDLNESSNSELLMSSFEYAFGKTANEFFDRHYLEAVTYKEFKKARENER